MGLRHRSNLVFFVALRREQRTFVHGFTCKAGAQTCRAQDSEQGASVKEM